MKVLLAFVKGLLITLGQANYTAGTLSILLVSRIPETMPAGFRQKTRQHIGDFAEEAAEGL